MGNPHAVRLVCNVDTAPVQELGAKLERHRLFPQRVNVGFMQIVHRRDVRLRVFERGVGETLACGTGACAAVVAGIGMGLLDANVQVHTRGGDLHIRWPGAGHSVLLTGPAVTVFEGEIEV
jgi:diaminopimelate epimerase